MADRFDNFIPDEWRSAWRSGRKLFAILHKTRAPVAKLLVGYGLPIILGLIYWTFVRPTFSAFAISASMTVVGLMAGFLINLMLSVGKSETLDKIDYETSILVVDRLQHLLWSLTVTFLTYVITLAIGIALLAMVAREGNPANVTQPYFNAIFVSGLFLVFIRSVFLPLQIVDLQQLQFDELLRTKQSKEKNLLSDRRKNAKSRISERGKQ